PAFKLLRNCALGSLVINDGGYEGVVTSSMTRMLQAFLRRVPVKALTLSHLWSYDFDIVDILQMAHGLERLTLIECDVGLITVKLLENLSTFGIAYVDVRFDSRFESVDHGIFAFLLGNDKVCTKSGRRELHLLNVIVSEGFFNTMIETILSDKSSTPVVLVVEGDDIVEDDVFIVFHNAIDDGVRVEKHWAYTRFAFDKCPTPFEVLFSRNRVELYRACSSENSMLINEVYVS
ncbi:hypothetical protein AAVH_38711, partial [Aphelenchoides avenae]